jgi:adenylate kinase
MTLEMSKFIVLLGPPGAGKGTQAQAISAKLQLPHISSGEIFRENLKDQTELGKIAEGYINRGDLVPDDITIGMIKQRLLQDDCRNGALMDGFPRTPTQAEALDLMLRDLDSQVVAVPYIKVSKDVLVARLTGRWTCPQCNNVYHVTFNPPSEAGICDTDGEILFQREDDKEGTVTNRIKVYHEQTQPLIDFYQTKGLLLEVNGDQSIEEVTAELITELTKDMV